MANQQLLGQFLEYSLLDSVYNVFVTLQSVSAMPMPNYTNVQHVQPHPVTNPTQVRNKIVQNVTTSAVMQHYSYNGISMIMV